MLLKDVIRNFCLNETQARKNLQHSTDHCASLEEFYKSQIQQILKYFNTHRLLEEIVIPDIVIDVMKKLTDDKALNTHCLDAFISYLKTINNDFLHDGIVGLINRIIIAIYDRYKIIFNDIQDTINQK